MRRPYNPEPSQHAKPSSLFLQCICEAQRLVRIAKACKTLNHKVGATAGAVRPELVRIITVWGNRREFPPYDLEGLKEECADDAYIDSLGQWFGIRSKTSCLSKSVSSVLCETLGHTL